MFFCLSVTKKYRIRGFVPLSAINVVGFEKPKLHPITVTCQKTKDVCLCDRFSLTLLISQLTRKTQISIGNANAEQQV